MATVATTTVGDAALTKKAVTDADADATDHLQEQRGRGEVSSFVAHEKVRADAVPRGLQDEQLERVRQVHQGVRGRRAVAVKRQLECYLDYNDFMYDFYYRNAMDLIDSRHS